MLLRLLSCRLTRVRVALRVAIEARSGDLTTTTDALLRPAGRLMTLTSAQPVFTPDETVRVELRTWKPDVWATCDLLWQGAWIWSQRVQTKQGRITLDLGLLDPARYDLQCSPHAIDPGEAWATLPLFVDTRAPMEVLSEAIEAGGHIHPSGTKFDGDSVTARTRDYLASHLRREVVKPHVLLSTRDHDLRLQREERKSTQRWLLGAMSFLVLIVLAFMADILIAHNLETRERMRAFALEGIDDGTFDPDADYLNLQGLAHRKSMLRTRGTLVVLVLFGTVTLNALGILAALYLSGG